MSLTSADLGGILKEVEGLKSKALAAERRLDAERARSAELSQECARLRQRATRAEAELERRGPVNSQDEAWLCQVGASCRFKRRLANPAFVILRVRGRNFRAATLDDALALARRPSGLRGKTPEPESDEDLGEDDDEAHGPALDQA